MKRSDPNVFTVKSGALFASDPCYNTNTWCAGKLENVKNGEWEFEALESEGRIAELWVYTDGVHQSHWEKVTGIDFGVDSGQFGFFDYDYFKEHENEREYGEPGFYNEACDQTLIDEAGWIAAGIVGGHGAVSSSGWGDGSYEVFVQKNLYGEIVAAKAVFITDEDEEEEYEEEEYEYEEE